MSRAIGYARALEVLESLAAVDNRRARSDDSLTHTNPCYTADMTDRRPASLSYLTSRVLTTDLGSDRNGQEIGKDVEQKCRSKRGRYPIHPDKEEAVCFGRLAKRNQGLEMTATALRTANSREHSQPIDDILFEDSITGLKSLSECSFHLILSDIPYGISADEWDVLHSNTNSALLGSSPAQKKAGTIFKTRGKPINGWSEADRAIPREYYEWCSAWAPEWFRVLKPGSSALVFAGRRFAHRCICAMEDAGFSFKDMLIWKRNKAAHRAQRVSVVFERRGDADIARQWEGWKVGNLRPIYEPILWFTKPYKIGTTIADNALKHSVGPYNEEAFLRYMQRPDNFLDCSYEPNEGGLHPTQKPVKLMQAIIELTTQPGQIVLDPFAGSGSTLVAARNIGRHFLGYETKEEYLEVCRSRLSKPDLFSIR